MFDDIIIYMYMMANRCPNHQCAQKKQEKTLNGPRLQIIRHIFLISPGASGVIEGSEKQKWSMKKAPFPLRATAAAFKEHFQSQHHRFVAGCQRYTHISDRLHSEVQHELKLLCVLLTAKKGLAKRRSC